jgi:hypothetical protein
VESVRTVMNAVHSKGLSTTQYSTIYDLKSALVYVLFYHNFEEFLKIDLEAELTEGHASYELSSLFADMRLLAPADTATVEGTPVTFRWSGNDDCEYQLHYSKNADFDSLDPIGITGRAIRVTRAGGASLVLIGLIPMGLLRRMRRHPTTLCVIRATVALVVTSCDVKGVIQYKTKTKTPSLSNLSNRTRSTPGK